MDATNVKLAELYNRLEAAYEAQDATLVFALCAEIADEINQQAYRHSQYVLGTWGKAA